MNRFSLVSMIALFLVLPALGAPVTVGQKLPDIQIPRKGLLVPRTKVVDRRMVLSGREIGYRAWNSREGAGKVRTIYHLAARMGVDDLNKAYIDALIAAQLPEFTPDAPYKTITILNLDDALWGTVGLGKSRLEESQRRHPYAVHVMDDLGIARAAWNLQPKNSAVIVLDRDNSVLFFKEGRLSSDEIRKAVDIIKAKVGLK